MLNPTLPLKCHGEVVHALCSSFLLCQMKMIILSLTELWGLNAKGTVLGWIRIFAVRSVIVSRHVEAAWGSSFQWDNCFDKVNCRCRIVEKAWALRQVDAKVEFLLSHLLTERPWESHLIPLNLTHKIGMIRSTFQGGCDYWMHWTSEINLVYNIPWAPQNDSHLYLFG